MEYAHNFQTHAEYRLGSLASKRLADHFVLSDCENFVETGTYRGDGVQWAVEQPHFKNIYSVELSQELAALCATRFADNQRVHLTVGDTLLFLRAVLPTLRAPTLLYLDAHISGRDSTYNPAHPVPLVSETGITLKSFYDLSALVVVVDDARLWPADLKQFLVQSYTTQGMTNCFIDDSLVFCHEQWLRAHPAQ